VHYHLYQIDTSHNGSTSSNIHRSISASSENQSGGLDQPSGAIDNPDQRIGEDIATFTANCVGMYKLYAMYYYVCMCMRCASTVSYVTILFVISVCFLWHH
jgi:ABC-type uncharacterized transport system fused permease/ATPase subunit